MTAHIDWQQHIETALTVEGDLSNIYDRFYRYSFLNKIHLMLQGVHEPVGTMKFWNALGRTVIKGSKAREIIRPIFVNIENEEGEKEQQLIGFTPSRSVFPVSETTGKDVSPPPLLGWDIEQALDKLGIRLVPFEELDGNVQGYSHGTEIAINPLATNSHKTLFHEMGHVVLGHTLPHAYDDYVTHQGTKEFQAEATAYLAMKELGQLDEETASRSRGYIQHWMQGERPPNEAIKQVFTATDRILKAGRLIIENVIPPSET